MADSVHSSPSASVLRVVITPAINILVVHHGFVGGPRSSVSWCTVLFTLCRFPCLENATECSTDGGFGLLFVEYVRVACGHHPGYQYIGSSSRVRWWSPFFRLAVYGPVHTVPISRSVENATECSTDGGFGSLFAEYVRVACGHHPGYQYIGSSSRVRWWSPFFRLAVYGPVHTVPISMS
jgi:hypothetical protein